MSQYSISLKSIINIKSHFKYNDDVFADTKKKIERGREIFFNFNYDGDDKFKELFERKFLLKNLEESIYCLDADLFILQLENEVKTLAPIYYEKYNAIAELIKTGSMLGDTTRYTRELNEEHSDTATSDTSASSSGTNKSKSSQFPQDINASSFENVNYMDSGNISENKSSSSSGNKSKSDGTAKHVETATTHNVTIDKLERYLSLQLNVIEDFVNALNGLFMRIW